MRLPRFVATTAVRETGLVRAQDIGALTNVRTGEFREIEQAGRAVSRASDLGFLAFMSRQAIDDSIEAGIATQRVQESWNKIDNTITNLVPDLDMPLPDDPDYNKTLVTLNKVKIDKMLPDLLGDVDKDAKQIFRNIVNPKLRARLTIQYNEQYADNVKRIKNSLNVKLNDYQLGEINKLATAAAKNGNADVANHYIGIADKHGLITHTKAVALKEAFTDLAKKSLIEGIKPLLIEAIVAKDKQAGLDILGVTVDSLVEDGLLTKVEGTEADKVLGDWIDSYVSGRDAAARLNLANAIENEKQFIDNIFILPREEFLDQATATLDAINESTILLVKDKEEQRAKINKRIEAISSGKIDPVDQFDPKAYDELSIRIARNSKAVKGTDISSRVGLGKTGGITTKQSEELTRLKKFYDGADILGNSLHRTYTSAITGLKTARKFSRDKTENIQFAAQARSILDTWAVQNPDATEEDYQAFFDRIIDNSRMNTWARGWFTRKAEEDRISIRENIEEIQKELAGETRKYKKGDTRIIGGITYTFDGKLWND